MDECEVCGRKVNELYLVDIEGAQMVVCKKDAYGRQILKTYSNVEDTAKPKAYSRVVEQDEVVENYGRVVKNARERLGLPIKVFAEKINEKESTLVRIEKEGMLPGDELAKKLEHALGIKLIIGSSREKQSYSAAKQGPITMGDAAMMKKKQHQSEEQVD